MKKKPVFLHAASLLAAFSACTHREVTRPQEPPAAPSRPAPPVGSVEPLAAPRVSVHAYGRAGDLVLRGAQGESLTIAATPDAPGHRPLRGAILDVHWDSGEHPDPLLWWMPGVLDAGGSFHGLTASAVEASECAGHAAGVRIEGAWEAVRLERRVCALQGGGFSVETRALTPLPAGAHLGSELVVGTSPAVLDRLGATWEDVQPSDFVALGEHGVAALLHTPGTHFRRRPIRIAAEVFPAPIHLWHDGDTAREQLRVREGDVLDALSLAQSASRPFTVQMPAGRRGEVTLLGPEDRVLARGDLSRGESRSFTLPPNLGVAVRVRDDRGLLARMPLPETAVGATTPLRVPPQTGGTLHLHYHGTRGNPLPVHVLLRGLGDTPDPEPTAAAPNVAAGRSLYLLRGDADVHLAAGRYRVVATHGFTWSLSARELTVTEGGTEVLDEGLREVVDTSAYVSGDFHLHSAPSPDSTVSFEARVLSLACEGVDLAVATDHNRISDFAPAARALGLEGALTTVAGNELTPASRLWGHFNAYPLPVPTNAPEDAVSAYYASTPAAIFEAARQGGARVLQVNHPRMDPNIGYFDLTHFDARTGHGDDTFANGFDAVEAFNGLWLETPEKVREGLRDLVGLARRGLHPTAMGNSDSHTLLFEEAGYPRTFVRTPSQPFATRSERVLEALLHGRTTVSSGPLVELRAGESLPGDTVRPARNHTVRVHVRVSAPAWVPVEHVELWVDDVVAQRLNVPGPATDGVRFERDVDLTVRADAVVSAWADADTPLPDVLPYPRARAIGFTSFLYVDADGDGRVVPPAGAAPAAPAPSADAGAPPAHHH